MQGWLFTFLFASILFFLLSFRPYACDGPEETGDPDTAQDIQVVLARLVDPAGKRYPAFLIVSDAPDAQFRLCNPPPAVGKVRSCGGAFLFVCQAAAAEEGHSDAGVQRTARRCVG